MYFLCILVNIHSRNKCICIIFGNSTNNIKKIAFCFLGVSKLSQGTQCYSRGKLINYYLKIMTIILARPATRNSKNIWSLQNHTRFFLLKWGDEETLKLGVHREIFLDFFHSKIKSWDSTRPDIAEVFQKNAQFLKICIPFLREKRTLQQELRQLLNTNKELAAATKQVLKINVVWRNIW